MQQLKGIFTNISEQVLLLFSFNIRLMRTYIASEVFGGNLLLHTNTLASILMPLETTSMQTLIKVQKRAIGKFKSSIAFNGHVSGAIVHCSQEN